MYNRKLGPWWPATPRTRMFVGDLAVRPPTSLALPLVQGLPRTVQCICMYVVCVHLRVLVYGYPIYRASTTAPPSPPPLHVCWRSNGASLPGWYGNWSSDAADPCFPKCQLAIQRCNPSVLSVSLRFPLLSLLPPVWHCFSYRSRKRLCLRNPLVARDDCPDSGNRDPLVPRRWFSLPCPSACYTKASHNCPLPVK